MVHRIPAAAVAIISLLGLTARAAYAQVPQSPSRILAAASMTHGRVHGIVRDGSGMAVADASILAVGQTVVAARSDRRGRFQMAVPPGDYILRVARDGYVSTYREPVRIQSRISLERTITLVKQGEAAVAAVGDSHAHTDLAWRLRHLPRSVLRDGMTTQPGAGGADPSTTGRASLFDRAVDTSLRFASRVAAAEFTGQVNFMTTTSANLASVASATLPRNVAFIVVGAPIGAGDWRVRGAVASGTESSWNVLGEYEARRSQTHALRFGLSHSAHGARTSLTGVPRSALEARSVTGVFAADRWRPLPDLELDYSLHADRYAYLASPYLVSASATLRSRVLPATLVVVKAARAMVAPGADEFLPPPAEGPWLPPERTFASLVSRDLLRSETVRHAELGLTRELGGSRGSRAIHVRAFAQQISDQIATLFGVGQQTSLGHYRVAQAGAVGVAGWAVGATGTWGGVFKGQVEYTRLAADWHGLGRTRGLRRVSPSVVRDALENLHDVTACLEATLNESRTRILVQFRSSTGFSSEDDAAPKPGSRFDLQVHQALPYRPLGATRLEVLFAARTMFRDPATGLSRYDELLTVAPPLRLMGGIQVRF
jgi:hypothetical protein